MYSSMSWKAICGCGGFSGLRHIGLPRHFDKGFAGLSGAFQALALGDVGAILSPIRAAG
jgi:hypothetical protein